MKHNEIKIIFSDIDGTLLNSVHRIDKKTEEAIKKLQEKEVCFVLSSSRGPIAIEPILKRYQFNCPMVAYGGALILDEDRNVLYENGFRKEEANEVIQFLEEKKFPLSYNIYTKDNWYVKERDVRIRNEEDIVEAIASIGTIDSIKDDEMVDKLLLMCDKNEILNIEKALKERFPGLSIAKSSNILIEVNKGGINKAESVKRFMKMRNIDQENSMAFGDNYNDKEMLECVMYPVLMNNAPEELKKQFSYITDDNNHDGIEKALKDFELI